MNLIQQTNVAYMTKNLTLTDRFNIKAMCDLVAMFILRIVYKKTTLKKCFSIKQPSSKPPF